MIRTIESFMERDLSKMRKEILGAGAIFYNVRIVGDSLLIKQKREYTDMEKKLVNFLISRYDERIYYDEAWGSLKLVYEQWLKTIHPELSIKNVFYNHQMDNGYAFITILLHQDIEKMIREGEVTKPVKPANVDTHPEGAVE